MNTYLKNQPIRKLDVCDAIIEKKCTRHCKEFTSSVFIG